MKQIDFSKGPGFIDDTIGLPDYGVPYTGSLEGLPQSKGPEQEKEMLERILGFSEKTASKEVFAEALKDLGPRELYGLLIQIESAMNAKGSENGELLANLHVAYNAVKSCYGDLSEEQKALAQE